MSVGSHIKYINELIIKTFINPVDCSITVVLKPISFNSYLPGTVTLIRKGIHISMPISHASNSTFSDWLTSSQLTGIQNSVNRTDPD